MGLEKIVLTDVDESLIAKLIADGKFKSVEEVVHPVLALLAREQNSLTELREAIERGDADYAAGRYKTYLSP